MTGFWKKVATMSNIEFYGVAFIGIIAWKVAGLFTGVC